MSNWLKDPGTTAEQYATDANLRARRALYEEVAGDNAPDVLWRLLSTRELGRVLEVGGGPGELAERMQRELGARVTFLDISPGMVELARARGVDARQGDVQELPFADASFDTVVAAWMLYHAPDLDRALAEIRRVLVDGGALVAVTNSERHLGELRGLMGYDPPSDSFTRESGEAQLRRHFSSVERVDAETTITVRDRQKLVDYRASMSAPTRPIPDDVALPFVTHGRVSIFVATR